MERIEKLINQTKTLQYNEKGTYLEVFPLSDQDIGSCLARIQNVVSIVTISCFAEQAIL